MSLMKVEDISFRYDREIPREISFEISRGSFISLMGVNGAGKSTLLRILSRKLRPARGSVYLGEREITGLRRRVFAQKLAAVSQYNEPVRSTVFDTILAGRIPYIQGGSKSTDYRKVEEILRSLGLEEYALRDASTLSGGEFQKVVLARALAQEPELILLDEPTSSLDIKNQVDVMRLMKRYCGEKGISAVLSIHDLNLALQFSDRFLLLKEGRILGYGGADIITRESIREVYRLEVEVREFGDRKIIILM